ncbi:YgjV family protein [Clostridium sp.]|uniref:YgjV family protein n=1 Tax=Clostridium sp. TaxID=1506 RepID=UPI003216D48E
MFGISLVEWLGYLASILIAISMFMKDIIKLRFINLIGCLLFAIYGFIIGSYPVSIVNILIVFINLYYLYKYLKKIRLDKLNNHS